MGLGLGSVLDRQRVDTLHDHDRLVFGDLAGGHRVPDGFVVVVQRVREGEAAFGVACGLPGGVGPPGGGVGGAVVGAEVEVVGLGGDPELELGEPVPQRGHRGEGLGEFMLAHRPESRVPELVEVGVDPCDQGRDRVRVWFAEYRCHTGNSGIGHRRSRAWNGAFRAAVAKYFESFQVSWTWWFRDRWHARRTEEQRPHRPAERREHAERHQRVHGRAPVPRVGPGGAVERPAPRPRPVARVPAPCSRRPRPRPRGRPPRRSRPPSPAHEAQVMPPISSPTAECGLMRVGNRPRRRPTRLRHRRGAGRW